MLPFHPQTSALKYKLESLNIQYFNFVRKIYVQNDHNNIHRSTFALIIDNLNRVVAKLSVIYIR